MPDGRITYSVVVPVYNSTNSIVELVERTDRVFRDVVHDTYEIIMVDDGSSNPETWKTVEKLVENYPTVRAFQLTRNFEKHGAVLCGFHEAMGEYVITMDDDLQHRPEDIPTLLTKKDHDIVIGNFPEKKHGILVRISSWLAGWFYQAIVGKPRNLRMSPYKLIKAEVVKASLLIKTPAPVIPALLFYVTKDAVSVDVTHAERKEGRAAFTVRKRFNLFFRLLINNSSIPLKAVAAIGFFMAFFSFIYSIYLAIKKFYISAPVSGWTSLMVVLLITTGLILFSLGVVGEYLIRIMNGTESRPPFIVRKKLESEDLDK